MTFLKKKYQFFISSTWTDFQIVRPKIFDQVVKLGHIPVGMEHFTSGEQLNKDFIRENIKESDIFVLILGTKSGDYIEGSERYTHFEYTVAMEFKKSIMPIMISDRKYEEFFATGRHDRNRDLDNFRSEVKRSGVIVAFYDTEEDIINTIISAAVKHFNKFAAGPRDEWGWLRAEKMFSADIHGIGTNMLTSEATLSILKDLTNIEVFQPRIVKDVEEKIRMAKLTCRYLATGMFFSKSVNRVYFDFGASTFYLAREMHIFANQLTGAFKRRKRNLRAYTNGIWIYLMIKLSQANEDVFQSIEIMPSGQTSKKFGVTWGEINNVLIMNPDRFNGENWNLPPDADSAVSDFKHNVQTKLGEIRGVIFMSATGFTPESNESLQQGLWVRSYYNMLSKRAMLQSTCIKVILMDGRKWGRYTASENPFYLFTRNEWEDLIKETPLAFCVTTYIHEKRDVIIQYFKSRNFKSIENNLPDSTERELHTMIFMNEKFIKCAYDDGSGTEEKLH